MEEKHGWVPDLPEPYSDGIYTDVEIGLGFLERIKVLLGKTIHVNVRTLVEHSPGKMETETRVSVDRFRWPWRKQVLFVAERD